MYVLKTSENGIDLQNSNKIRNNYFWLPKPSFYINFTSFSAVSGITARRILLTRHLPLIQRSPQKPVLVPGFRTRGLSVSARPSRPPQPRLASVSHVPQACSPFWSGPPACCLTCVPHSVHAHTCTALSPPPQRPLSVSVLTAPVCSMQLDPRCVLCSQYCVPAECPMKCLNFLPCDTKSELSGKTWPLALSTPRAGASTSHLE